MSRILVGVDAGGTRTRAALGDGDTVIARVDGAAGAVRPGRVLVAATAILDTVRRALSAGGKLEADVLVVGAAGVGREPVREELERALRKERLASTVRVVTDVAVAYAAAFGDDPGIVLVAGTGSIALARDASGAMHRAGGYGWQMGDEGGAYSVGRAGLAAVGRARDQRGPETALAGALPAAARVGDVDGLVAWATAAVPGEVAALARAVMAAAETGDGPALAIINQAAEELAGLAQSLAYHFPSRQPVPVALLGGMLEREPLRRITLKQLTASGRFQPMERIPDPTEGALALAAAEPAGRI